MKDIDRVNIQGGLVFEHDFDKVEKSGFEKLSFRGGDIIISPPVHTDCAERPYLPPSIDAPEF